MVIAIFDHHFWQKAPLLKSFNQFWLSNHHCSPCLIARSPFLMVKQLIRHFQVRTWWLSRCLKLKPAIQSRESCMTLWLHIQHWRCPLFSSSFLRSFLRRDLSCLWSSQQKLFFSLGAWCQKPDTWRSRSWAMSAQPQPVPCSSKSGNFVIFTNGFINEEVPR